MLLDWPSSSFNHPPQKGTREVLRRGGRGCLSLPAASCSNKLDTLTASAKESARGAQACAFTSAPCLGRQSGRHRSVQLDGGPEIWKVYYVGSPWRSTWPPAALALYSHTPSIWCLAVTGSPCLCWLSAEQAAQRCLTLQWPGRLSWRREGGKKGQWRKVGK